MSSGAVPVVPLTEDWLLVPVAVALKRAGLEKPSAWSSAVVVLRHKEPARAMLRGDFVGFLASNGLHASARECSRRRVPKGSLLVWLEIDVPEVAAARFVVFDFVAALVAAARAA